MTVGEKIKNKRLELGWSQDELAKKCGYKSRSSINKIELARDLPLKKIEVMAKVLGVTPGYLMGWEESTVEETYNKKNAEILIEVAKNPVTMKLNHYFAQLSKPQQESVLNLVASMVPKDEVEIIPDNHLSK